MHISSVRADDAIVPAPGGSAEAARLAWEALQPEGWPLPLSAFPADAALVGGAVRDALLQRLGPEPDLDLVVDGDAIALCKQLSKRHGGSAVVLDSERSIARLVIQGWSVDLARQEGGSLLSDLQRRDYTVNAMALPLADRGALVDPHGGLQDLAKRQLAAISEANLLDDPLRLLRGVRLASELGFALNRASEAWIRAHRERLQDVAGERVLAELEKLASAPDGHHGLQLGLDWGLLSPWQGSDTGAALPQLTPQKAEAMGLCAGDAGAVLALARLTAVLDPRGLKALRSSRKLQQRVERLRRWQTRLDPGQPAEAAEALPEAERLQLHLELEQDLPCLLLGWPLEAARRWLESWRDAQNPLFHPKPAIDGLSLQQHLGLKASPRLGALLQFLMLERAFGRLEGKTEVLEQASQWLSANPED
ncbi:MAG: CCA tRNA nucleotidyltransferase [Vulcanococcus sp.]